MSTFKTRIRVVLSVILPLAALVPVLVVTGLLIGWALPSRCAPGRPLMDLIVCDKALDVTEWSVGASIWYAYLGLWAIALAWDRRALVVVVGTALGLFTLSLNLASYIENTLRPGETLLFSDFLHRPLQAWVFLLALHATGIVPGNLIRRWVLISLGLITLFMVLVILMEPLWVQITSSTIHGWAISLLNVALTGSILSVPAAIRIHESQRPN